MSLELYHVRVPYLYSDCCRSADKSVVLEVYAKSPEHARHRAKRLAETFPSVHETYSTEIVDT